MRDHSAGMDVHITDTMSISSPPEGIGPVPQHASGSWARHDIYAPVQFGVVRYRRRSTALVVAGRSRDVTARMREGCGLGMVGFWYEKVCYPIIVRLSSWEYDEELDR